MSFVGIFASLILAADTVPSTVADPRGEALKALALPIFLIVIFYIVAIRPNQKRARELAQTVKTLKSGDKVVTSGGILGVVVSVKEKSITVRSGDTKLELLKSAVSEVTERAGATASAS